MDLTSEGREARRKEYLGRSLAVNPIALDDRRIFDRIKYIADFNNWHLRGRVGKAPERPEGIISLGEGDAHVVYGLGNIPHPERPNEGLSLTVRAQRDPFVYSWEADGTNDLLGRELGFFQDAFVRPKTFDGKVVRPPYFVSAIKSGDWGAMLTEDVSKGKTLEVTAVNRSVFARTNNDGSVEYFFLDPLAGYPSESGEEFLSLQARVDLD